MKIKLLLSVVLSLFVCMAAAQKYPERRDIRKGNSFYERGDFQSAEGRYSRALEKDPGSYEARYNLADALYKQQRFDEAASIMGQLAADSAYIDKSAAAYYNHGNALFQQHKLQEALEAYKESLRRNPDDMEAKFNLAYTQKLLEKDNNGGGGGGDQDQKDQNKDQNQQDQENDQNQDENQPENDDRDSNDRDRNDNQQNGGMDKETAGQLLDAMQAAEDNTKEKVDTQKARTAGRSGRNW